MATRAKPKSKSLTQKHFDELTDIELGYVLLVLELSTFSEVYGGMSKSDKVRKLVSPQGVEALKEISRLPDDANTRMGDIGIEFVQATAASLRQGEPLPVWQDLVDEHQTRLEEESSMGLKFSKAKTPAKAPVKAAAPEEAAPVKAAAPEEAAPVRKAASLKKTPAPIKKMPIKKARVEEEEPEVDEEEAPEEVEEVEQEDGAEDTDDSSADTLAEVRHISEAVAGIEERVVALSSSVADQLKVLQDSNQSLREEIEGLRAELASQSAHTSALLAFVAGVCGYEVTSSEEVVSFATDEAQGFGLPTLNSEGLALLGRLAGEELEEEEGEEEEE